MAKIGPLAWTFFGLNLPCFAARFVFSAKFFVNLIRLGSNLPWSCHRNGKGSSKNDIPKTGCFDPIHLFFCSRGCLRVINFFSIRPKHSKKSISNVSNHGKYGSVLTNGASISLHLSVKYFGFMIFRGNNQQTCNTRHSRGSDQLWEHAQHPALSSWPSSLGKPAHILKDSVNASIAIFFSK